MRTLPPQALDPFKLPHLAFAFDSRNPCGLVADASGNVSRWLDRSGRNRDLTGAGAAMPVFTPGNGLLFNGVANSLVSAAVTRTQPVTMYLVLLQVAGNTSVTGGASNNTLRMLQLNLQLSNGGGAACTNSALAAGTFGVVAAVHNGASSSIKVNRGAPVTGNPGTNGGTVLTLGQRGDGAGFCNCRVKALLEFTVAHDEATQARIVAALIRRYGIVE